MEKNFESRREPGDNSSVLGQPKVAAWVIVAALILMAVSGFGMLRGRAHTDGAGIANPAHEMRCRDLPVSVLDRCQVQRPDEPEEQPDAP